MMKWLFGKRRPAASKSKNISQGPASKPPIRQRIFSIVGEAQVNTDGTLRQSILLDTNPGEPLILTREPNNEFDGNAIRVEDTLNRCIGYFAREDAAVLAPIIDNGIVPRAKVHRITGGVADYPNFGCELSLRWDGQEDHRHRSLDEEQERFRRAKSGKWKTR